MMLRHTAVLIALFFFVGSTVAWGIPSRFFKKLIVQVSHTSLNFELGHIELIQALNLTPEQQKQLEIAFNRNKEPIKQNQQALEQTALELQALIEGTATSNQLRQKHNQLQQLRQQLENINFENMLIIREALTPEQRRKLSEFVQKQKANLHNQPTDNLDNFNLFQI
jgi:periplasmic protein CpxP/Spy